MIIDQIAGLERLSAGPLDDYWYGPLAPRTLAGVEVNEEVAMTLSTCWACTKLIAGTGAHLPFVLGRESDIGLREMLPTERLHNIICYEPNPEMSAMMWRASAMAQQINYGNCFAEIERDGRGRILCLWPIHASRVTMKADVSGVLFYEIKNNNGPPTQILYEDMFHVPSMMSDDGRWGKGVIRVARESFGHHIATQRYGAGFFGSGGRPTGVLKHPSKMDKDARANLRREWNEIYGGGPDSPNKTAVLWEGMDYLGITTSPEDMQFIQSQQHNVEEGCRWYGVQPHMIQHLLRATFSNIEQQSLEFVIYCMTPWLKLWRYEVRRKLMTQAQKDDGWYVKFLTDELTKGDFASRTAASVQKFFNGEWTLNEWRAEDDLNPIGTAGDVHFVQSAMVPLEKAIAGPQPRPAAPAQPSDNAPSDEPTDEPADDSAVKEQMAIHGAALDVLADVVSVMLDKEADAARNAAKKPAQFLAWLDRFYEGHEVKLRKALARPVRACVLASRKPLIVDEVLSAVVEKHIAAGRAALLEASGCPQVEFLASIDQCVSNWKRNEVIDLLNGGKYGERS